jgi:hypothetical protein
MATQKSQQKCHQFAVMGEREPIKKPKLGHKIENKGMNKSTQQILCTSSNEQQAIYVHHHLVVTFSLLHGPDSAFIFFHPSCCFCFCLGFRFFKQV